MVRGRVRVAIVWNERPYILKIGLQIVKMDQQFETSIKRVTTISGISREQDEEHFRISGQFLPWWHSKKEFDISTQKKKAFDLGTCMNEDTILIGWLCMKAKVFDIKVKIDGRFWIQANIPGPLIWEKKRVLTNSNLVCD